jgi:glycosyltransferase involved in cell wall biosynthesis
MKLSLIATVFNEAKTITSFLESIEKQTKLPDEIIITDGGSTDETVRLLSTYQKNHKKLAEKLFILTKEGNRSVGRNAAIQKATGDIIVISDAGCVLDRHWVEEIAKPFVDKSVDVVAGYYAAKATTIFQKCLVPFVFVMPDKVNQNSFLPASRSMAVRKSIWKELGGFPEEFSHNEDYVFAKSLQNKGKKIVFQKNAIVFWIPRDSFREAYIMFRRFAYGDAEAGLYRPKVILLLVRYSIFVLLFLSAFSIPSIWVFVVLGICSYLVWAVMKNYRYVQRIQAILYLPLLQLCADIAVMHGTISGIGKRIQSK